MICNYAVNKRNDNNNVIKYNNELVDLHSHIALDSSICTKMTNGSANTYTTLTRLIMNNINKSE